MISTIYSLGSAESSTNSCHGQDYRHLQNGPGSFCKRWRWKQFILGGEKLRVWTRHKIRLNHFNVILLSNLPVAHSLSRTSPCLMLSKTRIPGCVSTKNRDYEDAGISADLQRQQRYFQSFKRRFAKISQSRKRPLLGFPGFQVSYFKTLC